MLERQHQASILLFGNDHPIVVDGRERLGQLAEIQVVFRSVAPGIVPPELDTQAFNEWLWNDKKACRSGIADLTATAVFPSFNDLPLEMTKSPDYYTPISHSRPLEPLKAWCAMAEITSVKVEINVREYPKVVWVFVQGSYGTPYGYLFLEGGEASKALDPKPQVGWTVACLYAQREEIMSDGERRHIVCIREREKNHVKIFPVRMSKLMALNARVQQFSTQQDGGARTCHACQRRGTSLKACAGCSMFWYCDQECQTKGWREKGHKGDCKLLKDPDLKAMFHSAWDDMGERRLSFPL